MLETGDADIPRPTRGQHTPTGPAGSVWATGERSITAQITAGGYLPETLADIAAISPAIAAHAVTAYAPPGGVVLDPDCGAGTVLVEAVRAGRQAIGATRDRRWWALARANLTAAHGGPADGMVLDADLADPRCDGPLAGLTGHADLIVTTLRPGHQNSGAGPDPDREWVEFLTGCLPLLRPGGHLVVTNRPRYHRGARLDRPGRILAAGQATGLIPLERCVALTARLRGDRLITRASFARRRAAARDEQATGRPGILPAHHDVHVFRTPRDLADAPVASRTPHRGPRPSASTPVARQAVLTG